MEDPVGGGPGGPPVSEAVELLRALVAVNPWERDYDNDWCHYCFAEPEYRSKPWAGHRDGCVWVAARDWLDAQ